jgi:hypothetical protein
LVGTQQNSYNRTCISCQATTTSKWFSGPTCRKCYRQRPTIRNKELLTMSKYRCNNREKILETKRQWRQKNSSYDTIRCNNDILFKLKKRIRTRLCSAIKNNWKSGSAIKDLGCSIEELKIYLENQFEPWMNWSNYGPFKKEYKTWNIDHILPLSMFNLDNDTELKKACHFSNLRPLEAKQNLIKGNRYDLRAI